MFLSSWRSRIVENKFGAAELLIGEEAEGPSSGDRDESTTFPGFNHAAVGDKELSMVIGPYTGCIQLAQVVTP